MAEYRALPPAHTLPDSVWVDILSRLNGQDLARAMCTCRTFAGLQHCVFQASCLKRFPHWAPYLESECHWRRQYELLCLRDLAERTTPDVSVWRQTQSIITERHRSILVEWICEIALDWNVESAISCKAVSYLDQWLCKYPVDRLDRFQLIGIACLRTALGDMRRPTALVTDKHMDATTFTSLSDNSYSEDDVEAMTKEVMAMVDEDLRVAPNAKMFLRTYWYRACFKNLVRSEEMHIYLLASFLLQLGVLDLAYSGLSASIQGAAALSLALQFFHREAWPAVLQQYACYTYQEIEMAVSRLEHLQLNLEHQRLREIWFQLHHEHGYKEYSGEWNRLLYVISHRQLLRSIPESISDELVYQSAPPGIALNAEPMVE